MPNYSLKIISLTLLILYSLIQMPIPPIFACTKEESEFTQEVINEKKKSPEVNSYMDEFYKPVLPKGKFLLDESFYYFDNDFYGDNNGKIESATNFYSLRNNVKFSPLTNLEINLGFNRTFSAKATLNNYNSRGVLIQSQLTKLSYVDDYILNARLRKNTMELYLDILEKVQKSKRELHSNYNSPSHFRVSYKDFKFGIRHISPPDAVPDETSLSMITTPLLSKGQFNIEAELGYKEARLTRNDSFDSVYQGAQWYHTLNPHFIPRFSLMYGLSQDLELELGLRYITPYKYKYQRNVIYANGTNLFDHAKYKLRNNFYVPLEWRWRLREQINIALNSDFNYAKQTIDYFNKSRAGTVTVYPKKKLTYVKTEPTLTITYFNEGGKQIQKDEFSSLTKTLILKNQSLFEFEFKRDITNLYKGSTGGTQNIIDHYNIFVYPAEYFVFGTEYAYPYAGNYSYAFGNIQAQNYYQLKGSLIYGFTDSFNAGLTLGYHSASSQHNFMVPDYANRFPKFKPYYFIDPSFDWRVTKNSLLSLKSRIVPNYKTFFKETTIDRKGESSYYEAIVTFKTLL